MVTMTVDQKVRLTLKTMDSHGNPIAPLMEGTATWSTLPEWLNLQIDLDTRAAWAVAQGRTGTVQVSGIVTTPTYGDTPFAISVQINPGPPVGVGVFADTPVPV